MSNALTGTASGLYKFWNSFGLPAYPENYVPDDASLPYITYEVKAPEWRGTLPYSARVWYRDTSFVPITTKVNEIADIIGEGGARIEENGVILYLFKDNLFFHIQPVDEPDEKTKCAYLSMILHVLA